MLEIEDMCGDGGCDARVCNDEKKKEKGIVMHTGNEFFGYLYLFHYSSHLVFRDLGSGDSFSGFQWTLVLK